VFLGVHAYAGDHVLVAPASSAMRTFLRISDAYGREYSVTFIASKSKFKF
jgi:hypothetical protein